MSAVDWQPSQISVLRNSCARKKPSRIPASWSQLAKASGLTRERFAMADHLLRLICCPTIGVGGGVDQAGTRRGLFGSIHGSTGSSRGRGRGPRLWRSEEHTSELQSLMRISSAVFCMQKKTSHIKWYD